MKIAFIILAHNHPEILVRTAKQIADNGHYAYIHYDTSSASAELTQIENSLSAYKAQVHITSEFHCKWGEWSLVEAPLSMLRGIKELGWGVDYAHLMSGVDIFIKPFRDLEQFLSKYPFDFIESVNIKERQWVVGGLEIERFIYTYPFNHVSEKESFKQHLSQQIASGAQVSIPKEISPHMGSQWWTLRWSTCVAILSFLESHSHVIDYFKLCWIPDESFFQSVIRNLIQNEQIRSTQLVFHAFSQNGRPFLFMNGHEEFISRIPHFLIRKVSPYMPLSSIIKSIEINQNETPRSITPEILQKAKAKIDHKIKKAGSLTINTPWSYDSIDHGGPYNSKILVIIHDHHHDLLDIADQVNLLAHAAYIGRPFEKDSGANHFRLLVESGSIKTDYYEKNPLSIEHWQAIQATNPSINVYVFSYIPGLDLLGNNDIIAQSEIAVIRLDSGDPIRDLFLKRRIKNELSPHLQIDGQTTREELTEMLATHEHCY